MGGMAEEHVGSKSLPMLSSRGPTLQCGLGNRGKRRDPCPRCCRKSSGLGREKALGGLWGSSQMQDAAMWSGQSPGEQCHERAPWHLKRGTL